MKTLWPRPVIIIVIVLLLLNMFRDGNPSAEAGFQGALHLHTYIPIYN